MSDSIAWLVFDLGGVLVDVAPGAARAELMRRSATPPARLDMLLRERFAQRPFSLAERFQVGELDEEAFFAALDAALTRPLGTPTLRQLLERMLRGENAQTAALLARVARRWHTACYSNTNAVHWRYIQRHYGFFAHIERPFASQEIGYAKPDARGFAAVAAALAASAHSCLLIDDRAANVEGARAAGWQALAFTDAAALTRDLAALGVDMPPAVA